jgi:hypothetical protein
MILQRLCKSLRLREPARILLMIQVDGDHTERFAIDRHLRFESNAGLALARETMDLRVADGEAGEDGLAVFAAVVVHGFAKGEMETGETGEFGGLVDAVATPALVVDFLKRDEVGLLLADEGGDAVEIEVVVLPHPVVEVPGEEPELPGDGLGSEGQKQKKAG